MAKQKNQAMFMDLALHVATGGKVAPWCRDHGLSERQARNWTAEPEFKALVRDHRKDIQDRIVGLHAAMAVKATARIAELLQKTPDGPLAWQISKDVRDTYDRMVSFAEIDRRLAALEEAQDAGDNPRRAGKADAA